MKQTIGLLSHLTIDIVKYTGAAAADDLATESLYHLQPSRVCRGGSRISGLSSVSRILSAYPIAGCVHVEFSWLASASHIRDAIGCRDRLWSVHLRRTGACDVDSAGLRQLAARAS